MGCCAGRSAFKYHFVSLMCKQGMNTLHCVRTPYINKHYAIMGYYKDVSGRSEGSSIGSWSSWLAMETLLLSPPEMPGKMRPPITLWATCPKLSSTMTAATYSMMDQTGISLLKYEWCLHHNFRKVKVSIGIWDFCVHFILISLIIHISISVVIWQISVKGTSSPSCVWPQKSVFSKQGEQCMSESPPQSDSSRDCHSEREKKNLYKHFNCCCVKCACISG